MKKILLLAILFLTGAMIIWSQVPQAMTYKAVAKDDWGVALPNKTITLRFTILQGSGTGSTVYQETHTTVTNKFGLMDVEIGKGTSVIGSFDMIDWSIGIYYIQIEMDPNGGTNFRLEDPAHQLLSVPYALFAESSGNASFTESDPVFAASPSSGIWSSDIFNWNTAFSWGNHANEGYLKGFTESDPLFLLHPAHGIANENLNNWNTAYGWGDHTGLYKPLTWLPSWSEITENPFLISSPLANQLLSFNVVTEKWENWSPDYLTTEVDGSVTNEMQNLLQVLSMGNYGDGKIIKNIGNPVDDQDAATKSYVDALLTRIEALEQINDLMYQLLDNDDDGFSEVQGDHDDNNNTVYPGAPELCDGFDNNCDYIVDNKDSDNDGFIDSQCGGIDCNDNDETIHPGALEICDQKDNDCDGLTDNKDEDEDGYLDSHCGGDDCNDNNASIFPGAPEIIEDGIDQDCDGSDLVYDDSPDADNDTYTAAEGDCNDSDPSINPYADEVYDNKDNDCDGVVDEGFVCVPSSYEPNESCIQSYYLGEIVDTEVEFITRTGNATNPNDVDWFRVLATDATNLFNETFIIRINLVSNPGGAYVFDVYKSDCSTRVAYSVTEFVEAGSSGIEDTNLYYIKVYLLNPSQPGYCDEYNLRVSNGEE